MVLFLGLTIWVLSQIRRHQPEGKLQHTASLLLTVLVLQAAVGYTQYFTGVPATLVALHILGSCLVWIAVLMVVLHQRAPVEDAPPAVPPSGDGTEHADALPHGDLVS
jgi:cytochrome c oxidase assembly protein subunit 15